MALGEAISAGTSTCKGLYHMNGNSNDSSGNAYNGTDTSVTYVNGINGTGSASYNGTTSISVMGNDIWNFTGDFTVAFSFIPSNVTSYQNIISSFNISTATIIGYGFQCRTNPSGQLEFCICNDSRVILNSGTSTFTIGNKYRIVCKRISGTGNYIYVDGVLVSSDTSTFNPAYSGVTHASIGALEYLQGTYQRTQFFNGTVDEVIVENRAWTNDEVKKHFTFNKGRW